MPFTVYPAWFVSIDRTSGAPGDTITIALQVPFTQGNFDDVDFNGVKTYVLQSTGVPKDGGTYVVFSVDVPPAATSGDIIVHL